MLKKYLLPTFLVFLLLISFTFSDHRSRQTLLSNILSADSARSIETSLGLDQILIQNLEEKGFGNFLNPVIDRALSVDRFVFLFFYTDGCYFCELEKPIIDELRTEYADKTLFLSINATVNHEAVETFRVEGYPTMLLIYGSTPDGYLHQGLAGFREKSVLQDMMDEALSTAFPPQSEPSPESFQENIGQIIDLNENVDEVKTLYNEGSLSSSISSPPNHLVINEVMFNPLLEDAGKEWVELFNPTDETRNVDEWTLSNTLEVIATLPNWSFPNETYLIIHFANGTHDDDFTDGTGHFYTNTSIEVLDNTEDEVALYNSTPSESSIVDFVSWTSSGTYSGGSANDHAVSAGIWAAGDFVDIHWTQNSILDGESIGRNKNSADSDAPSDWDDHGGADAYFPTQGSANMGPLYSADDGIMMTQHKVNTILIRYEFDIINASHTDMQKSETETEIIVSAAHHFVTTKEDMEIIFDGYGSFQWQETDTANYQTHIVFDLSSNTGERIVIDHTEEVKNWTTPNVIIQRKIDGVYSTSYGRHSQRILEEGYSYTSQIDPVTIVTEDRSIARDGGIIQDVIAIRKDLMHSDTHTEVWKNIDIKQNVGDNTLIELHYHVYTNPNDNLEFEAIYDEFSIRVPVATFRLKGLGYYKTQRVEELYYQISYSFPLHDLVLGEREIAGSGYFEIATVNGEIIVRGSQTIKVDGETVSALQFYVDGPRWRSLAWTAFCWVVGVGFGIWGTIIAAPFGLLAGILTGVITSLWGGLYCTLFSELWQYLQNGPGGRVPKRPSGDKPDDNFDVSDMLLQTDYSSETGLVAIFDRGFSVSAANLLNSLDEPNTYIYIDFTPSLTLVELLPVLIIPSGGLYGLDSLPSFKAKLEEYVRYGGTLIVFSQQHGYEYTVLPGGEVSGYGWVEDMSCHHSSVAITTYHPILSGQDSVTADMGVDGYFTNYPENTTILLSRTKNAQPALLMYQYGNGTVIATTAYTDWAFTHSQATTDGITLIRDLLAFAKNTKPIQDYAAGDTITIPIEVANKMSESADKVVFTVVDPDKNVVNTVNVTVSISPNETRSIEFTYTAPSKLGIWRIDYSLYHNDNEIQTVFEVERFAVSRYAENPNGWVYQGEDLTFGVNSDSEHYTHGSNATFTIQIWNNGDKDKNVTVMWSLPHNYWATNDPTYWQQNKTLTVLAYDDARFVYSVPVYSFDRLWASFYLAESEYLGAASRGFEVFYPSVSIQMETDQREYAIGEGVSTFLNMSNTQSISHHPTVNLKVVDPNNKKIYEETVSFDLAAYASESQTFSFTLPVNSEHGVYIVAVEAYEDEEQTGAASTYFTVSKDYFATISFDQADKVYRTRQDLTAYVNVTNLSPSPHTLVMNVSIPSLDFEDIQSITVNPNETESFSYGFSVPENIAAGKHNIIVSLNENSTVKDAFVIPNSKLQYRLEKTQYSAGENVRIDLQNEGGVDASYTYSALLLDPYLNTIVEDSRTSIIQAGEAITFTYGLPSGAINGTYYLMLEVEDLGRGERASSMTLLLVDGLGASLTSQTEKRVYSVDEAITILANITNLNSEINDAILNLRIESSERLPPKPCVNPTDDLYIDSDTILCPGVFNVNDAGSTGVIIINSDGVVLDGKDTVLIGGGSGYGIYNPGFNDVTVRNIEVRNYYYGIYLSRSDNNNLTGNTANSNYDGIYLIFSRGNTFIDNTANLNTYAGIYLSSYGYNTLVNNTCNSNNNHGIYITGYGDNTLTNNTIHSNGMNGIYLNSFRNTITNNDIINNRNGLNLVSEGLTVISNNSIDSNTDYGISISSSSNNNISTNEINGNNKAGFFIATDSLHNSIVDNIVNGDYYYHFVNEQNKVIDGLILNASLVSNLGKITLINCTNITLQNLTLSNNTGKGLFVYGSNHITVVNSTINSNNDDGISLASSHHNTFTNNTADYNTNAGIYLVSSNNNTLTSNVANSNYQGIYLLLSNNNTLTSNVANSNYHAIYFVSAYGIYIDTSNNNTLTSNVANSNYQGIYLSHSERNTLADNTAESNTNNGIYLYYANNNTLTGNTANSNVGGLDIEYSDNNTLSENIFCANSQFNIRVISPSSGNHGDNNTCTNPLNWNDEGTTDCTYSCGGLGSEVSTSSINLCLLTDTPPTLDPLADLFYEEVHPLIRATDPLEAPTSFSTSSSSSVLQSNHVALPAGTDTNGDLVWEENVAIDVVDFTNISTTVEPLDVTGKLFLHATLYSSSGQIIAYNTYPFYITDRDYALTLETDQTVYKVGDTVVISGSVENSGQARNLTLTIQADGTQIYSKDSVLEANGSDPFITNAIANASFVLEGFVDGLNITDYIRVEAPSIEAAIIAPDVVGRDEFTVAVSIKNTGNVSIDLNVNFDDQSSNVTVPAGTISHLNTKMALTANTTVTVTISGDVSLNLLKNIVFGENAEIEVTPEEVYLEGTIEIPYTIINTGILDTVFNASFSIDGHTITRTVYLPVGVDRTDTLTFNLSKGMHILECSTPFWEESVSINVESEPEFILTAYPEDEAVNLGERVNISVTVENIGGKKGEAAIRVESPGLFDVLNRTWIEGGQQKNMTFTLPIPDDVEEKAYQLTFDVNGKQYETTIFIRGAKIAVDASLDQHLYTEGDNATVLLTVENLRDLNLTLYSRVKLGEYDAVQYFNLSSLETKTLSFVVPVVFDVGKMLYSIYMTSGRALYINALYVYPQPPESAGVTLYTDKQVYEIGENVTIYVEVTKEGAFNLTAPSYDNFSNLLIGSYIFRFTVPILRSGTYWIEYALNNYLSTYPIDVIGYFARILSSKLDRSTYQTEDTLQLSLMVDVNRPFNGLVQSIALDQANNVVGFTEANYTFTVGENQVELSLTMDSNRTGLHSIVYQIYAYGSAIFLASGARYYEAVDTSPPIIFHIPMAAGNENMSLDIYAMVTDNVNVTEVTLYHRRGGDLTYTKTVMEKCLGCIDTFNTTIPSSLVTTTTIEYYINATDGTNYATDGTAENPHVIAINLYPTAVILSDPTDITDTALQLTWTANTDPDFKNYTIYRSIVQNSLGTAIFTVTDKATTSYTVTGLSPETIYYFTVRIYDTGGLYVDSDTVSGKTLATQFPWIPLIGGLGAVAALAVVVLLMTKKKRQTE